MNTTFLVLASEKFLCVPFRDEGKAYMKCITQYMKNCPEVMQQSGALKLSPAMLQSGVDELCSIPFGRLISFVGCSMLFDFKSKVLKKTS